MPNNLDSNVSQIVLKKFLPGFMSDLVLAKTVDRQLLAGEINSSTGDSVSFNVRINSHPSVLPLVIFQAK